MNRLATETSPYLRQHADNPVDWYPWGDEAFAMAAELAPKVRVNAIAPGLVKTDMARALWEPNEARIAASMPLGRLGEPVDIANAALFLASDLASWITGHVMVVDGGALLGPAARR